jgi:hypothetical protein
MKLGGAPSNAPTRWFSLAVLVVLIKLASGRYKKVNLCFLCQTPVGPWARMVTLTGSTSIHCRIGLAIRRLAASAKSSSKTLEIHRLVLSQTLLDRFT